jgi:SAM-dependent methyltransferase
MLQRLSQRVFGTFSPHVPLSVKRPIKNAIPKRHWRYIDPNWHRKAIGLPWEELGKLQFEFLVGQGLRPEHYLLDVGCGPLRGGIHFIRYLERGHYYGIDRRADLLAAGRDVELPRAGLVEKAPVLAVMENFEFDRLGQSFDYALAQSVFTHLPLNRIIRCVMQMEKVLVDGGKFYATIYENERGKRNLEPVEQRPGLVSHFDEDYYHYDFASFEWACDGTSLTPDYVGDWNNPRNQKMLVFTKRPRSAQAA